MSFGKKINITFDLGQTVQDPLKTWLPRNWSFNIPIGNSQIWQFEISSFQAFRPRLIQYVWLIANYNAIRKPVVIPTTLFGENSRENQADKDRPFEGL